MEIKTIAQNKKAFHDYFIEETVEAGLVLTGSEIKSIRAGRVSLRDSYAAPLKGELWLNNAHIARYDPSHRYSHEPERPRKLLLHREQIRELISSVSTRGYTIVPLKLYLKKGRAKVELALARGKRQYDKRQAIAQEDAKREIDRAMKTRR